MNTQKKFLKVLSMLTIILLIATIFIPGNGNRNAVASIGILGILMLFLSTLLPKIYKLTLNLLKNQAKTSPWSSLKSSEPVSETEELLWRQISYQITDKLQAAFPNATWEFQKPPSMKQLLCGNPIRLRTFHTEDYNFAEARMNQYGYLELQMLTIASLKKTVTVTDEDDVPFADPESWYSLIGKKKLENLIGQLHAKGHHKLYINENGQIYIQNGDCFDYFPPRNYWDILISIFQKDELTAKEKDQALELSWIKE